MPKIPKSVVLYMDRATIDRAGIGFGIGAKCEKCITFLPATSECAVIFPPKVSGPKGVCGLYWPGQPLPGLYPMRSVSAEAAGYFEGAPTYCGICKSYENVAHATSECSKVGDTQDDLVQYGGCCNAFEAAPE